MVLLVHRRWWMVEVLGIILSIVASSGELAEDEYRGRRAVGCSLGFTCNPLQTTFIISSVDLKTIIIC